jgi:hypothetical protein
MVPGPRLGVPIMSGLAPRRLRRRDDSYESCGFRGFGHVGNERLVEPCARHDSDVRPLPLHRGSRLLPCAPHLWPSGGGAPVRPARFERAAALSPATALRSGPWAPDHTRVHQRRRSLCDSRRAGPARPRGWPAT